MTRSVLSIVAFLTAGAVALGATLGLELESWWTVPLLFLFWFGLCRTGRIAHSHWVRWCVKKESERPAAAPRVTSVLQLAARLHETTGGGAGFTGDTRAMAAAERAVLFPRGATDEGVVVEQVLRSTPAAREALVRGLRALMDESVRGFGSPLHPLFPDAAQLLGMFGHPVPVLFGRFRTARAWKSARRRMDPDRPEIALAIRLILADVPSAALAALGLIHGGPIHGDPTGGDRVRGNGSDDDPGDDTQTTTRIRTLARFLVILKRGESGSLSLSPQAFADLASELAVLVGRKLRELVPGSPFLAAVTGGAGALERTVSRTPGVVRELVRLHDECPQLGPPILRVLARILRRPVRAVEKELRAGRVHAEVDTVLQAHLRGLALLGEGRPREAQGEFEAVLRRAPGLLQSVYSLAYSHDLLGDPDRGEKVLRDAVTSRPDDLDGRLFLGRYLSAVGEEPRARAVYEAALDRFPRSAALRVQYAQQLVGWEDEDSARVHLELAHGQNPRDPRLAFLAGRARVSAGRPEEAVQPLGYATEQLAGGEQAEARFWLMCAFREQGRHRRALRLADDVVRGLGPGQEALLDELAEYLEERHEFLRARAANDRARQLRGDTWW